MTFLNKDMSYKRKGLRRLAEFWNLDLESWSSTSIFLDRDLSKKMKTLGPLIIILKSGPGGLELQMDVFKYGFELEYDLSGTPDQNSEISTWSSG